MTQLRNRKPLVVANWKMNGNSSLIATFAVGLKGKAFPCDVAICPPHTLLNVADKIPAFIGAQNVSEHASGAFTGDVSAEMLREVNCSFVIVGHSERREYHGETDAVVAAKVRAALSEEITPIVCVGESLSQRKAGKHIDFVAAQLRALKAELTLTEIASCVFAYEPIWAIGTGETATPEQAQDMHAFIRSELMSWSDTLRDTRILYGGSVKASNAQSLFAMEDVDGGLVGGASLVVEEFVAICEATE